MTTSMGEPPQRGCSPSEDQIQKLIERAVRGDQAAWTELSVRYRDRLRRMVTLRLDRRLQGRVDASDVIQEALGECLRPRNERDRRSRDDCIRASRTRRHGHERFEVSQGAMPPTAFLSTTEPQHRRNTTPD
jgi:hypothetical protein